MQKQKFLKNDKEIYEISCDISYNDNSISPNIECKILLNNLYENEIVNINSYELDDIINGAVKKFKNILKENILKEIKLYNDSSRIREILLSDKSKKLIDNKLSDEDENYFIKKKELEKEIRNTNNENTVVKRIVDINKKIDKNDFSPQESDIILKQPDDLNNFKEKIYKNTTPDNPHNYVHKSIMDIINPINNTYKINDKFDLEKSKKIIELVESGKYDVHDVRLIDLLDKIREKCIDKEWKEEEENIVKESEKEKFDFERSKKIIEKVENGDYQTGQLPEGFVEYSNKQVIDSIRKDEKIKEEWVEESKIKSSYLNFPPPIVTKAELKDFERKDIMAHNEMLKLKKDKTLSESMTKLLDIDNNATKKEIKTFENPVTTFSDIQDYKNHVKEIKENTENLIVNNTEINKIKTLSDIDNTAYFNRNDALSAYTLNLSTFALNSTLNSHTGDTTIHHTINKPTTKKKTNSKNKSKSLK